MITHKLTNKYKSGTDVYITLEYTDGAHILTRNYKTNEPSDAWVQKCADAEKARLEKLFAFDPPLATSDLPPDPGLSTEEQAYREAVNKLELARPLLDIGAITIQDKDLAPVIKVISDYVRARLGA